MYEDAPPSGIDVAHVRHWPNSPVRPPLAALPTQLGAPDSWDDMVRDALAAHRTVVRLRDAFEADFRRWAPGTTRDVAVLEDRTALAMIRTFLGKAKKAALTPPTTAFRSGQQVVKLPTRAIARKTRCWEIRTPHSWVLLLPNGRLALQAHPDEFSKIVTNDGREPVVIAGVNAPRPYGLSVEDVAAFVIDACHLAGLDW